MLCPVQGILSDVIETGIPEVMSIDIDRPSRRTCSEHKKSLCAENAEANSERNLYNPPSGLVLSLHIL